MGSKFTNKVVASATDIDIELGFEPKCVIVRNLTNGNRLEWVDGMISATGMLTTGSTGAVTLEKPTYTFDRTTTDLVFTQVSAGPEFVSVAVVDGGASGTAALAITGTGTEADPYVYTFTIYDNSNANNTLITLLTGDLYLTATGSQASDESTADSLAQTALVASLGIAVRGLNDTDSPSLGLGFVLGQTVGINATADLGDVLSIEAVRGDQLL